MTQNTVTSRPSFWRTNQGVGLILLAVLLAAFAFYVTEDWVFQRLRDKFMLGLLTLSSVVWMLMCTVAIVVDKARRDVTPEIQGATALYLPVLAGACVLTYLFFVGGLAIGFPIAMALFAAVSAYILGLRPMTTCLGSGAAISAVVFLIFFAIGKTLPLGPFEALLAG